MRPGRILVLSDIGGFHGGVENFIFRAAKALRPAGFVFDGLFGRPGLEPERFAGVFDRVAYGGTAAGELAGRADLLWVHKTSDHRLWQFLRRRLPDFVYVHDHDYYCLRRHKYFPWRSNCPLPANRFHCYACALAGRRADGRFGLPDWRGFQQRLQTAAAARLLLAGSDFMLDNLRRNHFPPQKLHKLSPLVDIGEGAMDWSGRRPDGIPLILYVGQLLRGKGVGLLLEAARWLRTPCRLRLVGRGNALPQLQQLAAGVPSRCQVEFVDFTAELAPHYAAATVAVFPSCWPEPFGMAGPEAMAHGLPVVACRVGGVPEWLQDGRNGLLVPPGRPRLLAAALDRLLEDPALAGQLGRQAGEEMRRFTAAGFAGRFLALPELRSREE